MKPLSFTECQVLPNFCFEVRGETKIWADRSIGFPSFMDQFADCDSLLARRDCQIIKDQKKIKIGRLGLAIGGRVRQIYIKRYNAFSLRYRLVSLMAPSGAVKSLKGAALLRDAGIRTARPLAAVENRLNGMLTKSFFLTEEIFGGKTADAYWLEDLATARPSDAWKRRQDFLKSLASLFRSLHAAQIYHNDLKDANILALVEAHDSSPVFFLLDLEGVRRYASLSEKRRIKNLVQLNRTLGRYIRRSAKLYFMKSYLAGAFAEKAVRKRLLQAIVAASDRLDATKETATG